LNLIKIKNLFILELLEAIKTQVFIVDERVANMAKSKWFYNNSVNLLMRDAFNLMRIYPIDVTSLPGDHIQPSLLEEKLEKVPIQLQKRFHSDTNKWEDKIGDTINLFSNDLRNSFFIIHQLVKRCLKRIVKSPV